MVKSLIEAYFLCPDADAKELAKRTGMTEGEVIEQLALKGLPLIYSRVQQEIFAENHVKKNNI